MADDEGLHLPDLEQLMADTTCPECGASFSAHTWPVTATLAAGDAATTHPVPARRGRCPECGAILPHPPSALG